MKFLITSDWHIRSTVPSCLDFTPEEWINLQREAMKQVGEIAVKNEVCDILIGGDIFHSENTASNECIYLVQEFIQKMNNKNIPVSILCGNHDLPQHSSSNIPKSAIGVLLNSKDVQNMNRHSVVKGCNFDNDNYGDSEYIFKHVLTIPKNDKPDFMECETPETLLQKYPKAKWIFTGDYHRNFEYHIDGRHVINSGCLTKQASDFEDYTNGVYIIDTEKEESKFIPLNVEYKFNHNGQEKKALDESIENFVEHIKAEDITLDYVSSLKKEAQNHDKPIQNKIEDWISEAGQ